ncbi:LuxR family transcriptional regulator [Nocardioides stalactiti]|uniref:LuxR family transcriptional regulator n=1 Tax=Nocardioides stalactiti TaxID=2755356 RepID=UPI0016046DF0|nr:LuxR family transcriptional regulator [Nocardioides stalactiti]
MFEVTAAGSDWARVSASSADDLCGRDPELAVIDQVVVGANPGCLLVRGPAGIGKSTLVAVAVGTAAAAGSRVLSVRAAAVGADVPFAAARVLLEPAYRDRERDRVRRQGPADLCRSVFDPTLTADPLPVADRAAAVSHGLTWLLFDWLDGRPALLVIDDLHLADPATVAFVARLVEQVAGTSVSIVATARSDAPVPELLQTGIQVLDVGPLPPEGVRDLVRALVPTATDDEIRTCAAITGRNPLFVIEALRAPHPPLGPSASGPQTSFLASVARRWEGLSAEEQKVGAVVAVIGQGAGLALVAAVAELSPEQVTTAAEALSAAALLTPAMPLAIGHVLVQEAILAAVPPPRRALLRIRTAQELAATDVEAAARQLLLAEGEHTTSWAAGVLQAAASAALRRAAPEAAATFARAGCGGGQGTPAVRALLARAESMAGAAGAPDSIRSALEDLPEDERAEKSLTYGVLLIDSGRPDLAHRVFRRGLRAVGTSTADQRTARVLRAAMAITGDWNPRSAELGDLDALVERALAGEATNPERMLIAHAALDRAILGQPSSETVRLAEAALLGGEAVELSDVFDVGAVTFGALALLPCGEHDRASAAVTPLIDDAARRGGAISHASALHVRCHAHLRAGRLGDAADDARAVIMAADQGWEVARPSAHGALAAALSAAGDLDGARAALSLCGDEARWREEFTWADYLEGRAAFRLAQGDVSGALADATAAGAHLDVFGADHDGTVPWRSVAVDAALAVGDRDRAHGIAEAGLVKARTIGAADVLGSALRQLALVVRGRPAMELLDEAVDVLAASPARLARARAHLDLGEILLEQGSAPAAREPLRVALDLAHHHGARPMQERAYALLRGAGARPRRTQLAGAAALTARERTVAEMAAVGASNSEIALVLLISPKTVEAHLGRCFDKLGVRSRREIAGRLADQQVD